MTRRRLSPDQRRLVRERQGNLCSCGCNEPLAARVEYDHDTALWAGGDNDIANFRALRPGCHTKKTVSEAKQRGKEKRHPRAGRPAPQEAHPQGEDRPEVGEAQTGGGARWLIRLP